VSRRDDGPFARALPVPLVVGCVVMAPPSTQG